MSEEEQRLASYRTAILALHDRGYSEGQITAQQIVKHLHRTGSESQLYADVSGVGGLKLFRKETLRSR
jgi:hypothetical protein